MNTTRRLADFVVSTTFDDIPRDVVERAKELILDAAGAAVLGSVSPTGKIIARYVKQMMGRPDAAVIGTGLRAFVTQAAFANGSLLHATELEADPMAGLGLPSQAIMASLAVGEMCRASGKQILAGFVLGYEMQGRISLAISVALARRGYVPSMVIPSLGCAASASKLMGLDVEGLSMAMGIAASQADGLMGQIGTMTHFLELGFGARNGVESALLAKEGITSMADVVENRQGFCSVFAGEGTSDLDAIAKDLGRPFLVLSPGVYVKKYTCCFKNHLALDAIFQLYKEHNISYEQVADIEVGINKYTTGILRYPEPKSGMESKFSLNHSIASAILKGKPDWSSWTDEAVADPKFKEARSKVKIVFHPEWPPDRAEARFPVKIRLKDGRAFEKKLDEPIDLTRDELIERYRACVESVLPADAIERSIDLILNLERQDEISQLMDLLRVGEQA